MEKLYIYFYKEKEGHGSKFLNVKMESVLVNEFDPHDHKFNYLTINRTEVS